MNNDQKTPVKVTSVTIMYGDRWKFLSQVVEAVMRDSHITTFVIVDNGAAIKGQIREGVAKYGDRIVVIETGKNLGSAGGFAKGIEYARTTDCDYVYLLDDDSVPEDNSVEKFMDILKFFPNQKVVLSGNRHTVLNNKEVFFKRSIPNDKPKGTFFEVFSFRKIVLFLDLLLMKSNTTTKRGPFIPIIPTEAFIYGGAFIPIEAVRSAPLPDASLFLYGDDIEYSWNIKKLGYASYLGISPRFQDVDHTFGENASHIFSQFDKKTLDFKVYYRLRNMVRLSRRHSNQLKIILFLNIICWVLGLYILGFIKYGFTSVYWKRVLLMAKAVYAGYNPSSSLAKTIESSFL
jgi:GT2 family glycosyltransferase